MKKIVRCFSLIICSVLFMFLLCFEKTEARYNRDENTISISVSKNGIRVQVKYQRGIYHNAGNELEDSNTLYYWCPVQDPSANTITKPSDCVSVGDQHVIKGNYVSKSENSEAASFISDKSASEADNSTTRYTFIVNKEDDEILNNLAELTDGNHYTNYVLFAQVNFCALREVNEDGSVGGCTYYDPEIAYARKDINLINLNDDYDIDFTNDIEDEGLRNVMSDIGRIVERTVMPIIWIVLGLFLIVKGALLGVQIVKAADEPQVRQEKVGALKWLLIGVAIAYASTAVITVLVKFMDGLF